MKVYSLLKFVILIFVMFSCTNNQTNNEKYFSKTELNEILIELSKYTEEKPSGVRYEDRFKDDYNEYYKKIISAVDLKLNKIILKDSLCYFLLTKNEIKSFHNDKRAIGGYFLIKNKKIGELDIKFITPMMPENKMLETSDVLFEELINTGEVTSFAGNLNYIEWPSDDVLYNKKKNRWYFSENSRYKVFESVMTGQN